MIHNLLYIDLLKSDWLSTLTSVTSCLTSLALKITTNLGFFLFLFVLLLFKSLNYKEKNNYPV